MEKYKSRLIYNNNKKKNPKQISSSLIPNAYETSWVMKDEADMIGDAAGTRVEILVFPHVCDQSDCVQGKKARPKGHKE